MRYTLLAIALPLVVALPVDEAGSEQNRESGGADQGQLGDTIWNGAEVITKGSEWTEIQWSSQADEDDFDLDSLLEDASVPETQEVDGDNAGGSGCGAPGKNTTDDGTHAPIPPQHKGLTPESNLTFHKNLTWSQDSQFNKTFNASAIDGGLNSNKTFNASAVDGRNSTQNVNGSVVVVEPSNKTETFNVPQFTSSQGPVLTPAAEDAPPSSVPSSEPGSSAPEATPVIETVSLPDPAPAQTTSTTLKQTPSVIPEPPMKVPKKPKKPIVEEKKPVNKQKKPQPDPVPQPPPVKPVEEDKPKSPPPPKPAKPQVVESPAEDVPVPAENKPGPMNNAPAEGSGPVSASVPGGAKAGLAKTNEYRSLHGASSLTWDSKLADMAQTWANGCKFAHGGTGRGVGQNLYSTSRLLGPNDDFLSDAVKSWYSEEKQYKYGANNVLSATGHFTQLVWKGTTKMGCAKNTVECPAGISATIVVCNYEEAGNMMGAYGENVSPKSG